MKLILVCTLLLISFQVLAQEYNYIQYNTKDGLAGSTVYRICQDKKGYMWFATENGVSMFDGKKFINFTTEDGLTDNEVLFIAADSKGRVWMMPFNKTVCYYYEGKIYNPSNDSTLKNIHFSSYGIMAGENNKGEIYFITADEILLYKKSGQTKLLADFKKLGKKFSVNESDFLAVNLTNQYPYSMVLYNKNSGFINKNDSFVYFRNIKSNPSKDRNYFRVNDSMEIVCPKSTGLKSFNSISKINDGQSLYNTSNGSWIVDYDGNVNPKPFFPDETISNSFQDNEGNIWFSTFGKGVYRLTSKAIKTFSKNKEVFCIENAGKRIYYGLSDGSLQVIKDSLFEKNYAFLNIFGEPISKRLYTMRSDRKGVLYLGFDSYLVKLNGYSQIFSPLRPIKSIDIIDENSIVVCTNNFTFKLRSSDLKIIDTIWRERGTKVIYDKGYYYIGTLNGLIIIDTSKSVLKTSKNIPSLNRRIVDICKASNGGFWIATNDNGVLLYQNGVIKKVINTHNGLGSNICKSLFLGNDYLWVGTNKGINKIDVITKEVLSKYSVSDGLASDIINAIYVKDSIIWVCSPAGLTYFKEKDISGTSICKLDLNSVYVSGRKIDNSNNLKLSYKNNNISFNYTAISFKASGEIIYKYKLTGLDDDWKETKLTTLTYPTLPSGEYELQIFAYNKFGKKAMLFQYNFSFLYRSGKQNGFL